MTCETTSVKQHAEWRYMSQRAVRYLSRFPSSERRFRTTMRKALKTRLEKRGEEGDLDEEVFVNALVDYTEALGYLNDSRLAQGLLNSYRRRGDAKRLIRQKLQRKGLTSTVIDEALSREDDTSELEAALAFVEKKRLWREWRSEDYKVRQKVLQRMARRGFAYGIAKAALEAKGS